MSRLKNASDPSLGPVPVKPGRGDEPFHQNDQSLGFELVDFWRWTGSNLLSNTTRGNLAEFLVSKALGVKAGVRATWEEYDLLTPGGVKIEVKSSAYIQVWGQKKYSRPTFGIGPSRAWDMEKGRSSEEATRHSDVYVFCLLDHKDQETLDPMDLSQWAFRVLATSVLDTECPEQRTIGWRKLERLGAIESDFHALKGAIKQALQ